MSDLFGGTNAPSYRRKPKTVAAHTPAHRQPAGEGKVCRCCKRFLPFDNFAWNAVTRLGRSYRCSKCRECSARLTREWNAKHRTTKVRDQNLWKHYRIRKPQYDAMLAAQGGVCAICGDTVMPIDPRTGEAYQLAVDHCHSCDGIRALLCPGCNNGLGCFRDDPKRLQAAIEYLSKHVHSPEAHETP